MKKIITLILIAALAICLCSCFLKKLENTGTVKEEFDKAVAFTESLFDTQNMTSKIRDTNDSAYITKFWEAAEFDGNIDVVLDVDVDGHIITLMDTKISELNDMGFEVTSGYEVFEPGDTATIRISKDDKFISFDTTINETDATIPLDDMDLSAFIGDTDEKNLTFNYRGLTAGSSLQEVIDTLGSPNYAASLYSDQGGTNIALDYLSEKVEGNIKTSVSLMISLTYDVETDSATLNELQIDCVTYNLDETEEAAE